MYKLTSIYKPIKEEQTQYKIFVDLDGVLADFDRGYKKLTGKSTKHIDVQDSQTFWDTFKQSLEDKQMFEQEYWENLEWMSDGKLLWNYVKKYNPYILTAPSINPASKIGKRKWVERLNNMKNIYFRSAFLKSDFARKDTILIDDRKDTIERWDNKGGIGILHISAENTIKKLQQLGL
jgi:hypothetical protein